MHLVHDELQFQGVCPSCSSAISFVGLFIRDLLQRLAADRVRYCLVGGVAVNLHGVPRMTYDVDIVVVPEADQLRAAAGVLAALGLRCRLPVSLDAFADASYRKEAAEQRNLLAVTYTDPNDPLREVDILVAPPVDAVDLVARAVTLSVGDLDARVVSIQDLIAMKKASGRAQDLADVAHLERIAKGAP